MTRGPADILELPRARPTPDPTQADAAAPACPAPPRSLAIAGSPVPPSGLALPVSSVPPDSLAAPVSPVPPDSLTAPGSPVPPDSLTAPTGPHLWLVPPVAAAPSALAPPAALAELDALLARGRLDAPAIARLAALAPLVPGRLRAVVAALADAADPAALDALLTLPQVPGALEALARALARGRTRRLRDGVLAPVFLALEFRGSRARPFPDLLRRAQLLAAEPGRAVRLEALRADGRPLYRLSFWPDELPAPRRAALATAIEPDLVLLHARLARLRGARLWLSGFCLPEGGPVSPAAQAHLLRAWLSWPQGHAP